MKCALNNCLYLIRVNRHKSNPPYTDAPSHNKTNEWNVSQWFVCYSTRTYTHTQTGRLVQSGSHHGITIGWNQKPVFHLSSFVRALCERCARARPPTCHDLKIANKNETILYSYLASNGIHPLNKAGFTSIFLFHFPGPACKMVFSLISSVRAHIQAIMGNT